WSRSTLISPSRTPSGCPFGLRRRAIRDGGLVHPAVTDKDTCIRQSSQLIIADAEFAKHLDVVFALERRRPRRRELLTGKTPRTTRKAILAAASVRYALDSAPIVAP